MRHHDKPAHTAPPRLRLADALAALPPQWDADPLPHIDAALAESGRKIVILDDDVMGTQSVHDIAVLMDWSVDALRSELTSDARAFFVVTNSRTMPQAQARAVNAFVARNLCEAARQANADFSIVSRLDSTLRGHFPAEMQAIESALAEQSGGASQPDAQRQSDTRRKSDAQQPSGALQPADHQIENRRKPHSQQPSGARKPHARRKPDAWIIAPLFLEGGRYTIGDTQYVADGEYLAPVADTEFAGDPAFAFTSSDLRNWVEEKTAGEVCADAVASVSIDDLRIGGPERAAQILSGLPSGAVCVVNGASNRDMEVFAQAMLQAESDGRRFLLRASASLIKALLGQTERPLLTPAELGMRGNGMDSGMRGDGMDGGAMSGGMLIVVGSHVPRTTRQLNRLLTRADAVGVEANVGRMLAADTRQAEIDAAARAAADILRRGENAVLYTSRALVTGSSADHSLAIGHQTAQAMAEIVAAIGVRPRCVIVKGGATSYAVATKALNVRRAWSPGQAAGGVPAWILGEETLHPGMPCIIFPGNVGGEDALADLAARLAD